jgi:MerR family transcriptional regulator, thiopeptide resistance regulator
MMLTVSKFARICGLSRSAVLYYESIGLLRRPPRSRGNYRSYGEGDVARLRQIWAYRNAGLSLADIRELLDQKDTDATSVLKRRMLEIDVEVARLRAHQREILRLLNARTTLRRDKMITKDKWVSIMRSAGFGESEMQRWHAEFEKSAPAEHQEFLEFLHIPAEEIRQIREWSRKKSA